MLPIVVMCCPVFAVNGDLALARTEHIPETLGCKNNQRESDEPFLTENLIGGISFS
jgi:hypothetical protein